jgi:MFS family permease
MKSSTNVCTYGILGLITIAMALGFFDRVNFSIALAAPEFQRAFDLTDHDRGLLSSAFFWMYAFLQVPAGWLVDRYGVRRTFAAAFLLWSAATAATAAAGSVAVLLGLRMLLGVGESVLSPGAMRWIRSHFVEAKRGLAVGVVMFGSKIGPAIGSPLSAWLLIEHGWRNMFLALGLVPLVWLIPWVAWVRDAGQSETRQTVERRAQVDPAIVAGIMASSFCYQYFIYFCLTWMPAYLVEARGLDLGRMAWYGMASFGGTAILAISAGYAADRLIARGGNPVRVRAMFAAAGLVIAATEVVEAITPNQTLATLAVVVALSAVGLTTANHWALALALVPANTAGRIAGLQALAASLPGIVAPILTAWLKQRTGGYRAPLGAVAVFLTIGVGCYLFLMRQRPDASE